MTTTRVPAGRPTGGQFTATTRPEADVDLAPSPGDWRDQPVTVDGRSFTFADVYGGRLFHGSPHPIADGETIEPGKADTNFAQSDADSVSITSGADIAAYWAAQAAAGQSCYVYEVEPSGPVNVWRAGLANYGTQWRLAEGRAQAARVLRRIDLDDARGYEGALMRGEDPLPRTPAVGAVALVDSRGEPVEILPGVIEENAEYAYTNGQCVALAIALAEQTGWPVHVRTIDNGDGDALLRHAAVLTPNGDLLDIDGPNDAEIAREMDEDFGDAGTPEIVPAAHARSLLDRFSLPPQDLATAQTFVAPVLALNNDGLAWTDLGA